MPLVKNTLTGNNYLVKINTDADTCSRTSVRSYNMQLGSQGLSGRTMFYLPFDYEPGSHTLWVFLDGKKVVVSNSPTDNTEYREYTNKIVQFPNAVDPSSVLEFIVAGSYLNEDSSGSGGVAGIYPRLVTGPGSFDGIIGDTALMVDTTGGDTTVVLPLVLLINNIIRVVKVSSDLNVVIVAAFTGDTIDGSTSITLTRQYDAVSLMPFALQSVWIEV